MALKAKELNLTFDIDEFTWGDLVDIKANDYTKFLEVCARRARIDGKTQDEVVEVLRQLSIDEVYKIDAMLAQAMRERSNPTDPATGKN